MSSKPIQEVKKQGSQKIIDKIADAIHVVKKKQKINITHLGKGSSQGSNIRWLPYVENGHMWRAYGGGDLNVSGSGEKSCERVIRKAFTGSPGIVFITYANIFYVSGKFDVTLGDEWKFDTMKAAIYRHASSAYDAGYWLEKNCKYKPFYHMAKFTLKAKKARVSEPPGY